MDRSTSARCRSVIGAAGLMVVLAAGAPDALAHAVAEPARLHGPWQALMIGLAHPFTGADHLAAMLAVGVWSALTMRRRWLAPLAFVSALLAGALLAMAGVVPPAIEPMIAASLLVLGLLVSTRARLPLAAGLMSTAGFALFHGAAHGQEFGGAYGLAALVGMVAATGLLHAGGIAIGIDLQRRNAWISRAAGVGIAALGASLIYSLT